MTTSPGRPPASLTSLPAEVLEQVLHYLLDDDEDEDETKEDEGDAIPIPIPASPETEQQTTTDDSYGVHGDDVHHHQHHHHHHHRRRTRLTVGPGTVTTRAGWQAAHDGFRNLISGYPRAAPMVEPFLYRHVGIWTERRLVRLMVRILQDPSLGALIRHLRCEFDVSEIEMPHTAVVHDEDDLLLHLHLDDDSPLQQLDVEMLDNILRAAWCSGPAFNISHPIVDDVEVDGSSELLGELVNPFDRQRWMHTHAHARGEVWAKVLSIIVCHAPNLESAVVRLSGRHAVHQDHSFANLLDVRNPPVIFPGRPWRPENPHFQTLTSLAIKPNRHWGPINTAALGAVFSLPALRRLEIHDDDGAWPHLHSPCLVTECTTLEELLLYHSRIREGDLAALCLRCPNLRVLLVHFSMWYQQEKVPPISINDALPRLAPSLRSLTLLRRNPGHYVESWPKRLTCLPRLRHLEHLAVDFKGLWGPVDIGGWPTAPLEDMLPTSLTRLEIIADWSNQLHGVHGAGRWYWNLLRDETRQVAYLRTGVSGIRFSKLAHFCIRIPQGEDPPYGIDDGDIVWEKVDPEWFEDWDTCT